MSEQPRHEPRTITLKEAHAQHHKSGFNQVIALALTKGVGSMSTAYSFVVLAIIGLAGIVGWLPPVALVLVAWFSQTFLQLVLLPVLAVGNNVLSKQAELQSAEQARQVGQILTDVEAMRQQLARIESRLSMTVTTSATPPFAAMEPPETRARLEQQEQKQHGKRGKA